LSLIKCPECKKEVSDTVESCIHCGFVLPSDASLEATSLPIEAPKAEEDVSEENENLVACPVCGEFSSVEERFCDVCKKGVPLTFKEWLCSCIPHPLKGCTPQTLKLLRLYTSIFLFSLTVFLFKVATHETPDQPRTTLSKEEVGERCFSRYLESDLMSSKAEIHFRDKLVLKTGENRYAARVKYTYNGYERFLNCGTYYLKDGEVWRDPYDG